MNIYTDLNREFWNHIANSDLTAFAKDIEKLKNKTSCLKHLELELLGNISYKSILHLQCFMGTESLSLSLCGAKVTAVDISDTAIYKAKQLAKNLDLQTHFIQSDIYSLHNKLNVKFDIIYTSYGVLSWLDDIDQWGTIISNYLKPNGKLVLIEFHPLANMYADDGYTREYPYFSHKFPLTFLNKIERKEYSEYIWTHNPSRVISALLKTNLIIESFTEYPYSTHNCFSFLQKVDEEKYTMSGSTIEQPLMYSIIARKKSKLKP